MTPHEAAVQRVRKAGEMLEGALVLVDGAVQQLANVQGAAEAYAVAQGLVEGLGTLRGQVLALLRASVQLDGEALEKAIRNGEGEG